MSDFLSNLITNVLWPAEVVQPRLGPFYGTSPGLSFPLADKRALDFATDAEELASGVPLSAALSARGPVSARNSDFSHDAQSPRQQDSLVRPENDAPQAPAPTRQMPVPFQYESTSGSVFSFQPSLGMDLNHESMSSSLTDQGVEPDDSSSRNSGEKAKSHLHESKAAPPVRQLNNFSGREKPEALRVRSDIRSSHDQAQPSPPHDFQATSQRRREERLVSREPLRSSEVAVLAASSPSLPALEPRLALPQLRPYIKPPAVSQDIKATEKHESIIRVNIGRIEVRAVMPPAPATPRSKRARSGPLLSLEDYLKQRNGVQR